MDFLSLNAMKSAGWATVLLLSAVAWAASKPHVVAFGKWTTVRVLSGSEETQAADLKVRALYVDGKLKEFTFGAPHEITDRLFVVRRVIRVNDALPSDAAPQWAWLRAGWLAVDRGNGHLSPAALPEFDPDASAASWYRDYAAYCGISQDAKQVYAVVVQLGRRKPILRKSLGEATADGSVLCPAPSWQRHPARVTFADKSGPLTYAVRGAAVVAEDNSDEDEDKN